MGQLALSMQNQSKDVFPSDTKKNPKDYMTVTLRSGRELEGRKENEKKRLRKKRKQKLEKRPSRAVHNWLKKLRRKRCIWSSRLRRKK